MSRSLIVCVSIAAFTVACGRDASAPVAPSSLAAGEANAPAFGSLATDVSRCFQFAGEPLCLAGAHATIGLRRNTSSPVVAPGAPLNLTGSGVGGNVTLSWTAPASSDPATAYIIEAGSAAGLANLANFSTGSTATTFSASGVGAGTYYVRVRAQNAAGTGPASNEIALVVTAGGGGCTAAPNAPGTLTASVSGSTVSLVWLAPSGGCAPTSYVLQAGSSSGLSDLANSNTGNTATSYVATGVGAGTYYVRVRAQNASGQSGPSNEVIVTVGTSTPLFTRNGTGNATFTIPSSVAYVRITGSYTESFPSCQNFIVYISYYTLVNEILGTCSYRTAGPTIDRTVSTYGGGEVNITGSSGVVWTFTEVR